jgi:hypothetical protein
MAPPLEAGADRAWRGLALSVTALAHAAALGGRLLDGDRLLLVRNPRLHSFAGLAEMLSEGRVLLRGAGLTVRDHAPLGALSTWLSWQWFRAAPMVQHAIGPALLLALVASLFALLRARRVSAPFAAAASLALSLHPCAADLSAPLAGRDVLLALTVAIFAARRADGATARAGVAWSAAAALASGLLCPGHGLFGLLPACFVRARTERLVALAAASLSTLGALAITRGAGPWLPSPGALGAGVTASLLAWIPSPSPFVAATAGSVSSAAWIIPLLLSALSLSLASRADEPDDAALLRAGAAAMLAAMLASALAGASLVTVGLASLGLHLGVVLALTGALRPRGEAIGRRLRPWMLLGFALTAALTAHRARGWSDDVAVLRAIAQRDPSDPESSLARARLELRQRRLSAAAPWCLRYALSQPDTGRADGCLGAMAAARGDRRASVMLLRRWAAGLDDRRALRAASLELSAAMPDPRFGEAFREATGYSLPQPRPGETP